MVWKKCLPHGKCSIIVNFQHYHYYLGSWQPPLGQQARTDSRCLLIEFLQLPLIRFPNSMLLMGYGTQPYELSLSMFASSCFTLGCVPAPRSDNILVLGFGLGEREKRHSGPISGCFTSSLADIYCHW